MDNGFMPSPSPNLLDRTSWIALEEQHHDEVERLTTAHRSRAAESVAHPVEDFLFTYYNFRPSQLRRWHPGAALGLRDATERSEWRFHRTVSIAGSSATAVVVDVTEFASARGRSLGFIRELLSRTAAATPQFGCFGLHEWAMVFEESDRRHRDWPLRLGQSGTDEVVRQHQIRCSHFDAFRFFTPAASTRNLLSPDLMSRDRMEQPACLHANMDLYKWAFRLVPLISSRLLVDCFLLAREIREVDMRASPYELSALGYEPIAIETAAGKAEYVQAQRSFADRGQVLRSRLCAEMDLAMTTSPALPAVEPRACS